MQEKLIRLNHSFESGDAWMIISKGFTCVAFILFVIKFGV